MVAAADALLEVAVVKTDISGWRLQPQVTRAVGWRGRFAWGAAVLLAGMAMVAGIAVAPAANADDPDCTGDLGDLVFSVASGQADLNNRQCAAEGLRTIRSNPAVPAAMAANAAAGEGHFLGDPFRAPHRWAGQRGSYELTTYEDRDGNEWSAALFGPLDANGGPYPGVLLACHACPLFPTTEYLSSWYWAAEALAEAGYVVMYAAIAGNSIPVTIDATDFFVATPASPTPRGDFNPWHARLDRSRLGIVGHSGAGGVALNVGHADPRYDAIVAWDPAGSANLMVAPRVPTMIQVADYRQESVPPPREEKPIPALSKFTFFDTISAAGVDAMQVALRASMHFEWSRFPSDAARPHSIHGEMVSTYYTLAWLDRYLAPSRVRSKAPTIDTPPRRLPSNVVAIQALQRLTASGTDRFDRSADRYSIGVGFFDADAAERAGNLEAGNVPITIGGLRIRNLLSFQYDSKYSLDGGALQCEDMRAGCSHRRRLARR